MDAIGEHDHWFRRQLAWSNTRQAWLERAGLAALLAVPVAILWYSADLSLSQQVVCWGGWLGCRAALLRHGWLKLFGPVLFYDLVRLARRRRYIALRCLYAIGLTVLLCWVYLMWNLRFRYGQPTRIRDQAQLAESFFFALMVVQSVLVVIL